MRKATTADAPAIAALLIRANSICSKQTNLVTLDVAAIEHHVEREHSFVLLEWEQGSLLGCIFVAPARSDNGRGVEIAGLAHIMGLAVDPDHWNEGVGKRLI